MARRTYTGEIMRHPAQFDSILCLLAALAVALIGGLVG